MALIGCSAGILHTAIFHAISPMYRHDPVATVNLGGMLFGLGCFTVALLVSGTFYVYSAPTIQVWIAIIPALFGWMYVRSRFTAQPLPHAPSPHAVLAELRSPGAVLFSLLLFFQFGNEWTIAGWLPLFLSQRLGYSPETSLGMLALYWFALLIGRIVAQWMMRSCKAHKTADYQRAGAMFGCVILIATDNRLERLRESFYSEDPSHLFIRWLSKESDIVSRRTILGFITGCSHLRLPEDAGSMPAWLFRFALGNLGGDWACLSSVSAMVFILLMLVWPGGSLQYGRENSGPRLLLDRIVDLPPQKRRIRPIPILARMLIHACWVGVPLMHRYGPAASQMHEKPNEGAGHKRRSNDLGKAIPARQVWNQKQHK